MTEWRSTTLGALVREAGGSITTGPFGSQLHAHEYVDDPRGVPVVMPKSMVNGRVDRTTVSRVSESTAQRLHTHRLEAGDVVLARRGDVGRCAAIEADEAGWLCGTGSMRIHAPDHSVVLPAFLKQVLQLRAVTDWLVGQAVGATMPNLNAAIVNRLPIRVPSSSLQQRISVVLDAFDDLIGINERRVEILEDLARSLYREWFERFRFPGYEEFYSSADDFSTAPESWQVLDLGEICSLVQAGSTPPRSTPDNWVNGTIPWFKTGELRDGPLGDSSEMVNVAARARIFDAPAILLAIYGAPTVGRMGWLTRASSCNQAALALRTYAPDVEHDWLWYQLLALRDDFNAMAQGAAQQNISKEKVVATRVLKPPAALMEAFAERVTPLRARWHELVEQNRRLAATRDLLLPRLVTGRLDISEIDLGDLLAAEAA